MKMHREAKRKKQNKIILFFLYIFCSTSKKIIWIIFSWRIHFYILRFSIWNRGLHQSNFNIFDIKRVISTVVHTTLYKYIMGRYISWVKTQSTYHIITCSIEYSRKQQGKFNIDTFEKFFHFNDECM